MTDSERVARGNELREKIAFHKTTIDYLELTQCDAENINRIMRLEDKIFAAEIELESLKPKTGRLFE